MIYGLVTAEVPDQSGEVCDYSSTKPEYQKVNARFEKATDGKSIMPLRVMHQLVAGGVGKKIEFDDNAKQIMMGFKVVDDAAWKGVLEGMYSGFSHGGAYLHKWQQKFGDEMKMWYTASPGEVSLVDNPCLPEATFQVVKTDGTTELHKFAVAVLPVPTGEPTEVVIEGATCSCPCPACVTGNCPECTAEEKCECAAKATIADVNKAVHHAVAQALKAEVVNIADAVEARMLKNTKTKRVGGKDYPASDFAYVGDPETTSTWSLLIADAPHVRNALARFNQTELPDAVKPKVLATIREAAIKYGIKLAEEAEKCFKAYNELLAIRKAGDTFQKSLYDVEDLTHAMQILSCVEGYLIWERDVEQDASVVPEHLHQVLADLVTVFLELAEEETKELLEAHSHVEKTQTENNTMSTTATDLEKKTNSVLANLHKAMDMSNDHAEKCTKAETDHHVAMQKAHSDHHAAMQKATSLEHAKTLASTHVGKVAGMHEAHLQHMTKLHGDNKEAMGGQLTKTIAGISGGVSGSGPSDETVVLPGGEAHTEKALTAKDIVDLVKAGIEAAMPTVMEKAREAVVSEMVTVLKAEQTAEETTAPGIGERQTGGAIAKNFAGLKVHIAQPASVTKAQDGQQQTGADGLAGMTEAEKEALVRKAVAGDIEANLKLNSLVKVTTQVPDSITAAWSSRSKAA